MQEKISLIYVTASSKEEAESISNQLIDLKLAACVNIFEGVTSLYIWEGEKKTDEEVVMIIKTKRSLVPELKKKVLELHSYSCPCVLAYDISEASEGYAGWIVQGTK